jgi:hypothetical protein
MTAAPADLRSASRTGEPRWDAAIADFTTALDLGTGPGNHGHAYAGDHEALHLH